MRADNEDLMELSLDEIHALTDKITLYYTTYHVIQI